MANTDRAGALGYGSADLARLNRAALELMAEVPGGVECCLSAQIGPRGDGYQAGEMSASQARAYHSVQIAALADARAEMISAFTIGAVAEATGMVLAAQEIGVPIVVAFTVETDGRLPDGTPLWAAIDAVDQNTAGAAAYFLENCAHPDHLRPALTDAPALFRLAGVVANASRKSHAELDCADVLDDGDPGELAGQLAAIRRAHPWMSVFGGCCGTDMRHLAEIGRACGAEAR